MYLFLYSWKFSVCQNNNGNEDNFPPPYTQLDNHHIQDNDTLLILDLMEWYMNESTSPLSLLLLAFKPLKDPEKLSTFLNLLVEEFSKRESIDFAHLIHFVVEYPFYEWCVQVHPFIARIKYIHIIVIVKDRRWH